MAMSPPLLITFVVFSVANFPSCFSADQQYEECRSPLRCGAGSSVFPNITYPFWGNSIGKPKFCGQTEFELSCKDNQSLTLEIKNLTLRVVSANLNEQTITVADESLLEGGCPKILSFSGDDQFTLNLNTETVDLFDCSSGFPLLSSTSTITCQESNANMTTYHVFGASNPSHNCRRVGEIPMLGSAKNVLQQSNDSNQALKMALEAGFELRYNIKDKLCRDCSVTSGICGSEPESGSFRCLCAGKTHVSSCNDDRGLGYSKIGKIGIGFASGLLGIILLAGGWFCFIIQRRKTSNNPRHENLKALIPLKHYTYAQVKRITKSFTEVVGKGGFGTVYKGTLSNDPKARKKHIILHRSMLLEKNSVPCDCGI